MRRAAQRRRRQDPEYIDQERTRWRDRYHTNADFRERIKNRTYWDLTGVEYAEKLLENRRRASLRRSSARELRAEGRSEGG